METRSMLRGFLQSYISSQWPDLPARFDSLNDDTLTTVLQFVGNNSYKSFGVNKRCREFYLATKGMMKETFLFGYAPLSRITDRITRSDDMENDLKLQLLVGAGVVFYSRRDVVDWALEERKKYVLKGICILAVEEGRFNLLEEIFNAVEDWDEKEDVFKGLGLSAAYGGKLNVLEWLKTHQLDIDKEMCAQSACDGGHIHIIQWLREEKGLELHGKLYVYSINNRHLHVMKWLREQNCPWYEYTFAYAADNAGNLEILQWLHDEECPWGEYTFYHAAKEGSLEVLQWLHDAGCPWDHRVHISEDQLKPGAIDWLHRNGYGDRISV